MPIDSYLAGQPEPVRRLLEACRDHLHHHAPGLQEALKWGVPTFMLGRNVFYLNPKADHVILGFVAGAHMTEFRGVFDHIAAEVAHVVVRTPADLQRPGLREAIRAAVGLPAGDFGEALVLSKAELAAQGPSERATA